MYSTKNIENILLAELLPNQYRDWMQDSQKSSKTSFRDMLKLRKSNVFQQIFGNKQRIWLKLDIENTNKEEKQEKQKFFLKDNNIPDIILDSFYYLLYGYYLIKGNNNIPVVEKLADDYAYSVTGIKLVDMYVNGYIINPDNQKEEKLGKFYQKVLQLLTKNRDRIAKYYGEKEIDELISTINGQYKIFNLRKETKKDGTRILDKDIVSLWDNTPLDWYACISRDPQDVGAMSTGQGWSSCQDLDKNNTGGIEYNAYNWHTLYDVPKGTCIAYLINSQAIKQSRNRFKYKTEHFPLLNPTARVSIKPFYNKKGEIYLSIGIHPRIYGNNRYTHKFVDTVQKYLENKQSNINGEFRIPRELYNESIGNANTVIVQRGKIIDTAGKDDMFDTDPALVDQMNNYFAIYDDIFDYYNENIEYPSILFNTNMQNRNFDNVLSIISNCRLENCEFDNLSLTILDTFSETNATQIQSIIESELNNLSQEEFADYYNTTFDKNKLLNFIKIYIDSYINYKIDAISYTFSVFINCQFNDCEKIIPDRFRNTSFLECTFNNSKVTLPILHWESHTIGKCNFGDCYVFIPYNRDGIVDECKFDKCDIECELNELYTNGTRHKFTIFENCQFDNCLILNNNGAKSIPIDFKHCTVNGEYLQGHYRLNKTNDGTPITMNNLRKIS